VPTPGFTVAEGEVLGLVARVEDPALEEDGEVEEEED